ncbi:MAG: hypothetical protein PVI07_11455 [Anaerolineae bacterium]|jgi:hypothetical protein
MKPYRRWAAIIAAAVVLLTAAGCLPAAGEETPASTSTPTRPPNLR